MIINEGVPRFTSASAYDEIDETYYFAVNSVHSFLQGEFDRLVGISPSIFMALSNNNII